MRVRGRVRIRRAWNMDDYVVASRSLCPPAMDMCALPVYSGYRFSPILLFFFGLRLFEACTELYVDATTIAQTL